jgi:outer membrane protein OmpA-like peptidoglycan-associated protein
MFNWMWTWGVSLVTVLAGCANQVTVEPYTHQKNEKLIEWVGKRWALCDEPDCPQRTPKTVELLAQAPVMPRVAMPTKTPERAAVPPVERQQQEQRQQTPVVIRFAFAKADMVGDWRSAIDAIAESVRPNDLLLIKGYTDDVGGAAYNDRLAWRRAEAVADALMRRGIKNPMEIEARGKCCYVASNATEQGRAENRRAEVHFFSKGDRM